ncbi:hypothetical protein VTN77DRAFT_2603 [Rasamsonia byssochlamydoides]|uniref:uncharacterized protein n=1 Tax=Rasamsonia byssochlamydoides TaxID=89139 RepID=UPI003742CBD5
MGIIPSERPRNPATQRGSSTNVCRERQSAGANSSPAANPTRDGCRKTPTDRDKNVSSVPLPEVFSLEQWPATFPSWLASSFHLFSASRLVRYHAIGAQSVRVGVSPLQMALAPILALRSQQGSLPTFHQHPLIRDNAIYEMRQMQKNEELMLCRAQPAMSTSLAPQRPCLNLSSSRPSHP